MQWSLVILPRVRYAHLFFFLVTPFRHFFCFDLHFCYLHFPPLFVSYVYVSQISMQYSAEWAFSYRNRLRIGLCFHFSSQIMFIYGSPSSSSSDISISFSCLWVMPTFRKYQCNTRSRERSVTVPSPSRSLVSILVLKWCLFSTAREFSACALWLTFFFLFLSLPFSVCFCARFYFWCLQVFFLVVSCA